MTHIQPPIVVTPVAAGTHQQFKILISREGLGYDTIELQRNLLAKVIALAMIDETGLVGYATSEQELSPDEINFRKKQDTQQDCNDFCAIFGYYRYNPITKQCKCSHWVDTSLLKDKILKTQNADEYDSVYITKPSLNHWEFNGFTSIHQDIPPVIPSMITLSSAKLYDPKLFKTPRDSLRCHTTIGAVPNTLNVRCAVEMCFAEFLFKYDSNAQVYTASEPNVTVLEQVTLDWHTRSATADVKWNYDRDINSNSATITNLNGYYVDECAELKNVFDSSMIWDKYSEQRGAFVVTIVDYEKEVPTTAQGQAQGGSPWSSGSGSTLPGTSGSGGDEGEEKFILTVDVVTDRTIQSARCRLATLLGNFELLRKIQMKMQEFDALRFIEVNPVFHGYQSNVPAPPTPC